MMKSPASPLQGQSFLKFIDDDLERQFFENQLTTPTIQNGKVGVCNTTLTDCLRNRIRVEMFFVKVAIDVDNYQYLLGIREFNQEACGVGHFPEPPNVERSASSQQDEVSSIRSQEQLSEKRVSSRGETPGGLRNPHLKRTKEHGQHISIDKCLSSWNINVKRRMCCTYHAYVMTGKKVLKEFAEAPCRKGFPFFSAEGLQCQTCGIIVNDAEEDEYETCPACDSVEIEAFSLGETDGVDFGSCVEQRESEGLNHFKSL
eukprot:TRINITY_DN4597_c0_g1_i3.p2 TRINITY_DN4597_c0_g1~~TRINITY_DN4597_c0_g1_i3.p2  ORF type:complete len:259 (-),score=31.69 TRINITY_DN4597_c0_g1_i3:40-816(-)